MTPGGRRQAPASGGSAGRLDGLPRAVPLTGQPNFRDLGGYGTADGHRVRFGVVFRSGVLDRLTDADVEMVARLRLATVVDLRDEKEAARRPDRLPSGPRTVQVPVGDISASPVTIAVRLEAGDAEGLGAEALIRGNRSFVLGPADATASPGEDAAPFGAVLRAVMDPANHPVLFHCTAGKDRAGFVAALVLLALGVPAEAVLHDYLASNTLLAARHEAILAAATDRDLETLRAMLQVRAEYLQAALDAIAEVHGGIDRYLVDGLGLSEAERGRFREAVLGPA